MNSGKEQKNLISLPNWDDNRENSPNKRENEVENST